MKNEYNVFTYGFLSASLRDCLRFGRLYLNHGQRDGVQIIPAAWVARSVNPEEVHLQPGHHPHSHSTFGYGYQWWLPENPQGDFAAIGIWGQHVYIHPGYGIVIAKTSADQDFDLRVHETIAVFQTIAQWGDRAMNLRKFINPFHITVDPMERLLLVNFEQDPDQLPVPMDCTRMPFTRYSPKPLIAMFNPAFDGEVEPLVVEVGATEIREGDVVIELTWTGDKPALKRLTCKNKVHPLVLRFEEAFPDIQTLANASRLEGHFEIEGHPSTGRIGGRYTVEKGADQMMITVVPSQGWRPRPTKFSLWFLYTIANVFRKWPATYEWTACIHKKKTSACTMRSA